MGFRGWGLSGGAALAGSPDFWNVCALPGGLSSLASGSCLRTQENNRHVAPGLINCVKALGAELFSPAVCLAGPPILLPLPLGSLLEHPWLWETHRQNHRRIGVQRVGLRLVTCVCDIISGRGPGQSHCVSFGTFICLLVSRCRCRDTFPSSTCHIWM